MSKMVAINADKARNLKFNYNALCMLEEDFNIDVSALDENIKLGDLRKLMYCGLVHEDSTLTLERTGEIMDAVMDEEGMEYLGTKIGEAITKAFGTPKSPVKGAKKK